MDQSIAIIVPCRLESTRFPRKLLHPIRGKPLILWVAERISSEAPEFPLYFAVDHESLRTPLDKGGYRSMLTSTSHLSGTDRIAEANRTVGASRVINVQADEPLVSGGQIRALSRLIAGKAPMATLATRFHRAEDFMNPNQVKVAFAPGTKRALFFSRSPIPYARERMGKVDDAWVASNACFKHLGLYAYHSELLEKFSRLPPGRLEQIEKLEQLRVLENGFEIACEVTEEPTIGIDTLDDAIAFDRSLD